MRSRRDTVFPTLCNMYPFFLRESTFQHSNDIVIPSWTYFSFLRTCCRTSYGFIFILNCHRNHKIIHAQHSLIILPYNILIMNTSNQQLLIMVSVFATFNNILVISWRSILLVKDTRLPWENHPLVWVRHDLPLPHTAPWLSL